MMSRRSIEQAVSLLDDIVYWMEFVAARIEKGEMNQEDADGLKVAQEKYLQLTERLNDQWAEIKDRAGSREVIETESDMVSERDSLKRQLEEKDSKLRALLKCSREILTVTVGWDKCEDRLEGSKGVSSGLGLEAADEDAMDID